MAKLITSDISNITGAETTAINTINDNFAAIETALENTLSRDGTSPNTMSADLDLNSNDITNVNSIEVQSIIIDGETVTTELLAVGDKGWSPAFSIESNGSDRVLKLVGYVGGEGTEPTDDVGKYVGDAGYVTDINDAVNIRGPQGNPGNGTGDLISTNNLSDVDDAATAFATIKQAATDSATGVVELATDVEVETGTDTARAVTPAGLTAKEATVAEWRANTSDRILTTDIVNSAMQIVALTDAATVAWDMSTGIDFSLTLGGNRTLGNPTNTVVGRRGRIQVNQDGTGSRTLTLSSNLKTVGGAALSLSTGAGDKDFLDYDVVSASFIRISLSKDWS